MQRWKLWVMSLFNQTQPGLVVITRNIFNENSVGIKLMPYKQKYYGMISKTNIQNLDEGEIFFVSAWFGVYFEHKSE